MDKSEDLYALLSLDKAEVQLAGKQAAKLIAKAYRKAALKCHPDKPGGDTELFQRVQFAYNVLKDDRKRKSYDVEGITDDLDDDWDDAKWTGKISTEDVESFKKTYQGSDEEFNDLKVAYEDCKGTMSDIIDSMWFANDDDEERFREKLNAEIKAGNLKVYKTYSKKLTAKQREKRRKEREMEAIEAEEAAKEIGLTEKGPADESSLHALIQQRQAGRSDWFSSFAAKYGEENENDEVLDFSKESKGKKRGVKRKRKK